MKHVYYLYRN